MLRGRAHDREGDQGGARVSFTARVSLAAPLHDCGGMKTPLIMAAAIALIGTSVTGCATTQKQEKVESFRPTVMVMRDVPDSDKQFPFGPAPFVGRPASDLR